MPRRCWTLVGVTLVAHTHQPAAFLPRSRGIPVAVRPRAGETVAFGESVVLNAGAVCPPQLDGDERAYRLLLDLDARRAT